MFKKGDKIVKKNGEYFANGNLVVTVELIEADRVYIQETGGYIYNSGIKLADPSQAPRQKLKEAIELVQSYGVQIHVGQLPFRTDKYVHEGIEDLLDELFPIETPQQLKLKELEQKQREIAAQMEQLRKELV